MAANTNTAPKSSALIPIIFSFVRPFTLFSSLWFALAQGMTVSCLRAVIGVQPLPKRFG